MMREDFEKLRKYLQNNENFKITWLYVTAEYHRIAHFGFKNRVYPFLDMMVSDRCGGADRSELWNDWLSRRRAVVGKVTQALKQGDEKPYYLTQEDFCAEKPIFETLLNNAADEYVSAQTAKECIIWGVDQFTPPADRGPFRCYPTDWIFPLKTVLFEGVSLKIPNKSHEVLTLYYGDYKSFPARIVYDSHLWAPEYIAEEKNLDDIWKSVRPHKYAVGYTCGVFDVFHRGHLNVLKKAKEQCDFLIVAVSDDSLVEKNKHKTPMMPLADRMALVENMRQADKVIVQRDTDKIKAWQKLRFDVLFVGSDHKGEADWNTYEAFFKTVGTDVIYIPHTDGISSTLIRQKAAS